MRHMVEKNFILVWGKIWMPCVEAAYQYDLKKEDIENIGEFTRENVEDWLSKNAGDFSEIIDFYATIGDEEIKWADEENGMNYWGATDPVY